MPDRDRKGRKQILKREMLFWGLIVSCFLLDILTKYCAFEGCFSSIPFLNGQVRNYGGMFGIKPFGDFRILFSIVGFLLIGALIFFKYKINRFKYDIIIAILIGGALGNIYDRLRFGAVRDFIQWPTFNVADVLICVGVGFYIIDSLYRKEEENGKDRGTGKEPEQLPDKENS